MGPVWCLFSDARQAMESLNFTERIKRAIRQERSPNRSRRRFLLAAIGAAVAGVIGYVIWEQRQWITVGPVGLVPKGTYATFTLGKSGAFLQRTEDGNIVALAHRCTHQGCVLIWETWTKQFRCPCHAGIFDESGTPISGPPIRSLERLETRVESGTLEVLM
jgi:nitrite reductase/ring-hydroxylating ferredoxin subunit